MTFHFEENSDRTKVVDDTGCCVFQFAAREIFHETIDVFTDVFDFR